MPILEIKDIPPDAGTSLEPTELYNPLNEDFTWAFGGKPYTIPAKSKKLFAEKVARHLAKHLARKIVYGNYEAEVKEEIDKLRKMGNLDPMTPSTAKAVPVGRVEEMEKWLLTPVSISPEKVGAGEEVAPPQTKLEETLTEKEKEVLAKYHAKVSNLEKARKAKKTA